MIYGIDACSLIDYPGKISFVIFMGGCNFRCPFCHNKDIVEKQTRVYPEEKILTMLDERKGFIKAVTITGGEPTIYGDKLIAFVKKIKALGYNIKLDTNGLNTEIIRQLINEKLIDFIAMDIKNTFDKYEETIGVKVDILKIKESIRLIENSNIEYEFRTTINKEMHPETAILELVSYVSDNSKLILQSYKYSNEQLKDIKYTSYNDEELEQLKLKYNVTIR